MCSFQEQPMNFSHSNNDPLGSSSENLQLKTAQEEALSRAPTAGPDLKWRKLSLDNAISPLLSRPVAPFGRDERQRAYTSAVYYSECFLKGITPKQADKAAYAAQASYDKWWVDATCSSSNQSHSENSSKRKGPPVVSDDSVSSLPFKRQRRHEKVRDFIDGIACRKQALARQRSHALSSFSDGEYIASHLDFGEKSFPLQSIRNLSGLTRPDVERVRDELISLLGLNGGNIEAPECRGCIQVLDSVYTTGNLDSRLPLGEGFPHDFDGVWLAMEKPVFSQCVGHNENGDPIYPLGRLSFDMFQPTATKCSIQGMFSSIQDLDPAQIRTEKGGFRFPVPKSLEKDLSILCDEGMDLIKTHNIVIALTIEDTKSPKPIRGILTNYGYMVSDPDVPNRHSVWFTGGSMEVNDEGSDLKEWRSIFETKRTSLGTNMSEYARRLAAKIMLGAESRPMDAHGTMTYQLSRPIGGHGAAYSDTIYMDEKLRLMRGHHGTMYAFTRVNADDE